MYLAIWYACSIAVGCKSEILVINVEKKLGHTHLKAGLAVYTEWLSIYNIHAWQ